MRSPLLDFSVDPALALEGRFGLDRRRWCLGAAAGVAAWVAPTGVGAALTRGRAVKLALIDPLSGPVAEVGRNARLSWAFLAQRMQADERLNPARVGFHFAAFDNAGSPQTSVNMVKAAIDQGFRYFLQGNGSGVAAVLIDAMSRHNRRNPDDPVLLLNYAAMDPSLTNERCSYWHFRLDADTAMKMRALVMFLAQRKDWKRIYLVNQDYAHGQQVSAHVRRYLAELAPDVVVVGDDLHPAFASADFGLYAKRVAASGAQAVISGNWGADLQGLMTALHAQGVRLPLFSYYAGLKGTPSLLAGLGESLPVFQVATYHDRLGGLYGRLAQEFRQEYDEDLVLAPAYDALVMLMRAMYNVQSTSVRLVAAHMSGMWFEGFNGSVHMRSHDHQLQKGVFITRWVRQMPGQGRSAEGTGWQFVPVAYLPAEEVQQTPRCEMHRPDY